MCTLGCASIANDIDNLFLHFVNLRKKNQNINPFIQSFLIPTFYPFLSAQTGLLSENMKGQKKLFLQFHRI